MTAVERYVDEDTDAVWAVVHSPMPDGFTCIYGEPHRGEHGHLLDTEGNPTGVLCSWEEEA